MSNIQYEQDQRDLVLDQSQYALVLTETKGTVIPYVGPTKTNLDTTDKPVRFDSKTRKFIRCSLDESIKNFPRATEGNYIILENPADDGSHPDQGAGAIPKLQHGRKINIPGPATFPLFPGQVATVVEGHQLRSNHYVVIRVYNVEEARKNWNKLTDTTTPLPDGKPGKPGKQKDQLTIGKLLIIKGTEESFYIPANGFEVVPDAASNYVRDAVTLERLEYAILLDENGNKTYRKGPDVVFPEPTQTFVEINSKRKFKARELSEITGIHIKVIADYEEAGKKYKAGDEVFITGKDQSIYYPRPEHAIIKYGDREIHYATVIPEGEARYVLDRLSGKIEKVIGPSMYLPNPTKKVMIRRILDSKTVQLWYPGNEEALQVNQQLSAIASSTTPSPASSFSSSYVDAQILGKGRRSGLRSDAFCNQVDEVEFAFGDELTRKSSYTKPRTLTLDTKYDGVPRLTIWTGYAVMLVNQKGERRVVKGPATLLPEYDEHLEALSLSTGKPKNTDVKLQTVYLRVLHNKVSDLIEDVETKDLVKLDLKVSYRVNFTGDEKKWFDAEDYVKLLCDHYRSRIKCAAKKLSIEELYLNAGDFVRDTLLGKKVEGKERVTKSFENGMQLYDVEILDVTIKNHEIERLLIENQKNVVEENLELASSRRSKNVELEKETIERELEEARAETEKLKSVLTVSIIKEKLQEELALINKSKQIELGRQAIKDAIASADLARDQAANAELLKEREARLQQDIVKLQEEVKAYIEKAKSISPQMVAALQSFSDKQVLDSACKSMAPLAILGGGSVAEVVQNMLGGTSLGDIAAKVFSNKL